MTRNVGKIDRLVRLVLAVVLAVLYFTGTVTGTWGIVLLVIAAIMLITAILGFCPLYCPLGISTCKRKDTE